MNNEIKTWNYESSEIRTVEINNEPWFVGKDVAEVLGYAKPRNAIATHVDDEDKKDAPIQGTLGGTQNLKFVLLRSIMNHGLWGRCRRGTLVC